MIFKSKYIVIVLCVFSVLAVIGRPFAYQAWQEQAIIKQAQESAMRQNHQHIQEEIEAKQQNGTTSQESTATSMNESTGMQTFSGTLQASSYRERASIVGASVEMFPDAPVTLFILEAPTNATGYSIGDGASSVREIAVIRVPDNIGRNGESATIDICEPVYWPSDVSGLLWDLDLSELESLKAEPRS